MWEDGIPLQSVEQAHTHPTPFAQGGFHSDFLCEYTSGTNLLICKKDTFLTSFSSLLVDKSDIKPANH